MSANDTMEEFGDRLNLWVVELVRGRVRIHSQGIDGGLVTGVQSSRGIGRIRDERVNRVCHLMTQDWELVHLHLALVLSIDHFMCNQAARLDKN